MILLSEYNTNIPEELISGISHEHFEEWRKSGVDDVIIRANVWTIHEQLEVDKLLHRRTKKMWHRPNDLVPCWAVRGIDPLTDMPTNQGVQIKANQPRINEKGKPIKYEGARDSDTAPLFLDTGKQGYWPNILEDVNQKIFICEGAKKAGALLSNNFAGVSIPGVTTCRKRGRLHQNLEIFAKVGRVFYLCFDNDILTKKPVQDALKGMGAVLKSFGSVVKVVQLPPGEFKGVDDYIAACGADSFQILVDNALTIQEWVDESKSQELEEEDTIPNSRLARHYSLIKEEWGDKLRYNSLSKEVELSGVELNEDEVRLTMALKFDIDITSTDAHSIISNLAKQDEYSPVVEYLDEIAAKHQDIDPTFLDGLSLKYFGSSEAMHATYFKKFLISAVARARNPGCKVDTVLMLVGPQGCGKSSFLQNLFGRDFFTDQIGGELNDKDEKAKVSRYWCLEYAEFEAVYRKKDVSSLKRFITSQEDTFRAPYARKEARHPRPSIFAGTTNENEILLDPTGDRRFWVLKIALPQIPLSELLKERDKIWAAADALYKKGHEFFLTKEEEQLRTDLNKEFRKTHYWDDLIEKLWIDSQPMTYLTTEMIARCLGFETAASVKGIDLHTMKECLERLGFTKTTKRINGTLSRSCWERKSFSGNFEFIEKTVSGRNTVTTQFHQDLEPVTPPRNTPVTPVTVEEVNVNHMNSSQNSSVTVLHPPVTPPVTYSNPYPESILATVTGVTPLEPAKQDFLIENQKSEIEYILPSSNAELLRECIADQNWEMIQTLTESWDAGYKLEVWACLSPEEKQAIKDLKKPRPHPPENLESTKTLEYDPAKIPLIKEKHFYWSKANNCKIQIFVISVSGKSAQCRFDGKKGIHEIPFDDIACCDESPTSNLAPGDKVLILVSGKKAKISSIVYQSIYLKDEKNKSIRGEFYSHQVEKIK